MLKKEKIEDKNCLPGNNKTNNRQKVFKLIKHKQIRTVY